MVTAFRLRALFALGAPDDAEGGNAFGPVSNIWPISSRMARAALMRSAYPHFQDIQQTLVRSAGCRLNRRHHLSKTETTKTCRDCAERHLFRVNPVVLEAIYNRVLVGSVEKRFKRHIKTNTRSLNQTFCARQHGLRFAARTGGKLNFGLRPRARKLDVRPCLPEVNMVKSDLAFSEREPNTWTFSQQKA